MTAPIDQLRLQAGAWSIELDETRLSLLEKYARILAEYELSNVIGTRDPGQIVVDHLLDALSCLLVESFSKASTLIDVGAGGGLPGIPLAIVKPELRATLLEATEKKVAFLDYARAALDLENLSLLNVRAEEAGGRPEYRGTFDVATARALAALPVVVEYCAPLLGVGGIVLAMKGRLSEEELAGGRTAARKLGLELREMRKVEYLAELPQKERRLVVFEKVEKTPGRFPRRMGLAKKQPLDTRE